MSGNSEFSATAHGVVTLPDSAAAPVTAQVQVQADESALTAAANALQSAATLANTMHGIKGVPKAVLTDLAKQEAALITAKAAAVTAASSAGSWLTANPVPVPSPIPSGQIFGINGHDLMWTAPGSYPISELTGIHAKVYRNDLIASDDIAPNAPTGYAGAFGSAQCCSVVNGWAAALRAADIEPWIVVTFSSVPDTATFAQNVATIAKACPGMWWEIGNELDLVSWITASEYVSLFAAVVTAIKAADPTCKIGPSPVANINFAGDGWNWIEAALKAGLGEIPYDFLPFHNYPWPTDTAPTVAWSGQYTVETAVPEFTTQCTAWGNTKPYAMSEFGYASVDGAMTPALQSEYVVEELQCSEFAALPILIAYELNDDIQTYGWMTNNVAKPVYAAAAALN